MRTYLVVVDSSPEARVAARFAGRRAAGTGGRVVLLTAIPKQDFVAFGAVAATMASEARADADLLTATVADEIASLCGISPTVVVREGDAIDAVRTYLAETPEIAALVLGAAASGHPGPIIGQFTGLDAGALPCPVMLIPGSLSESAIDALS